MGAITECKHLCMMVRGIEKQNAAMSTCVTLGKIREDSNTHAEFLRLLD